VPVSSSIPVELLPPDPGGWQPVTGGESGASVFYDPGQERYAKLTPPEQVAGLAAERDRTVWLNQTAIPSPRVLDWRASDAGACLVTQAVEGVPASELGAPGLRQAWPSIAATVRSLHGLATDQCPFERTLEKMMPLAEASVEARRVVVEFLPVAMQRTPPEQILKQIKAELTVRVAQERTHLVVCHGDLCLPNILVDPSAARVTGLIDLGRLGTADPYADIALLLATARETWSDEAAARRADQEFAETYGTQLDPERQDFYLRLDPLTW
jgi:streptomycin 3"-kinase